MMFRVLIMIRSGESVRNGKRERFSTQSTLSSILLHRVT
jgi:hypothetical protein